MLNHKRGMMDVVGMRRMRQAQKAEERCGTGNGQPQRQPSNYRAWRERNLNPSVIIIRPSVIGGSGEAPVRARVATVLVEVGAGVAEGAVTALEQLLGSVPGVERTGRNRKARAGSAWVEEKASGAAVAEEPGRE